MLRLNLPPVTMLWGHDMQGRTLRSYVSLAKP
jgi:hypothetical protein